MAEGLGGSGQCQGVSAAAGDLRWSGPLGPAATTTLCECVSQGGHNSHGGLADGCPRPLPRRRRRQPCGLAVASPAACGDGLDPRPPATGFWGWRVPTVPGRPPPSGGHGVAMQGRAVGAPVAEADAAVAIARSGTMTDAATGWASAAGVQPPLAPASPLRPRNSESLLSAAATPSDAFAVLAVGDGRGRRRQTGVWHSRLPRLAATAATTGATTYGTLLTVAKCAATMNEVASIITAVAAGCGRPVTLEVATAVAALSKSRNLRDRGGGRRRHRLGRQNPRLSAEALIAAEVAEVAAAVAQVRVAPASGDQGACCGGRGGRDLCCDGHNVSRFRYDLRRSPADLASAAVPVSHQRRKSPGRGCAQ